MAGNVYLMTIMRAMNIIKMADVRMVEICALYCTVFVLFLRNFLLLGCFCSLFLFIDNRRCSLLLLLFVIYYAYEINTKRIRGILKKIWVFNSKNKLFFKFYTIQMCYNIVCHVIFNFKGNEYPRSLSFEMLRRDFFPHV